MKYKRALSKLIVAIFLIIITILIGVIVRKSVFENWSNKVDSKQILKLLDDKEVAAFFSVKDVKLPFETEKISIFSNTKIPKYVIFYEPIKSDLNFSNVKEGLVFFKEGAPLNVRYNSNDIIIQMDVKKGERIIVPLEVKPFYYTGVCVDYQSNLNVTFGIDGLIKSYGNCMLTQASTNAKNLYIYAQEDGYLNMVIHSIYLYKVPFYKFYKDYYHYSLITIPDVSEDFLNLPFFTVTSFHETTSKPFTKIFLMDKNSLYDTNPYDVIYFYHTAQTSKKEVCSAKVKYNSQLDIYNLKDPIGGLGACYFIEGGTDYVFKPESYILDYYFTVTPLVSYIDSTLSNYTGAFVAYEPKITLRTPKGDVCVIYNKQDEDVVDLVNKLKRLYPYLVYTDNLQYCSKAVILYHEKLPVSGKELFNFISQNKKVIFFVVDNPSPINDEIFQRLLPVIDIVPKEIKKIVPKFPDYYLNKLVEYYDYTSKNNFKSKCLWYDKDLCLISFANNIMFVQINPKDIIEQFNYFVTLDVNYDLKILARLEDYPSKFPPLYALPTKEPYGNTFTNLFYDQDMNIYKKVEGEILSKIKLIELEGDLYGNNADTFLKINFLSLVNTATDRRNIWGGALFNIETIKKYGSSSAILKENFYPISDRTFIVKDVLDVYLNTLGGPVYYSLKFPNTISRIEYISKEGIVSYPTPYILVGLSDGSYYLIAITKDPIFSDLEVSGVGSNNLKVEILSSTKEFKSGTYKAKIRISYLGKNDPLLAALSELYNSEQEYPILRYQQEGGYPLEEVYNKLNSDNVKVAFIIYDLSYIPLLQRLKLGYSIYFNKEDGSFYFVFKNYDRVLYEENGHPYVFMITYKNKKLVFIPRFLLKKKPKVVSDLINEILKEY